MSMSTPITTRDPLAPIEWRLDRVVAGLQFRQANLVRELYEHEGKSRSVRNQIPSVGVAERHQAFATLTHLDAERARLAARLRSVHEQLECALSLGSPPT